MFVSVLSTTKILSDLQQLQAAKTSVKTKASESYRKFVSTLDRTKLSLERTCEATKRKKLIALRKKSNMSVNGNVNRQNSHTEYTIKTKQNCQFRRILPWEWDPEPNR